MRFLAPLFVLAAVATALPAAAQPYPWPGYEADPAVMAARARAADAAQRARSDEQAAFARQQMDSARITRLELDAARRALPQPPTSASWPSPLDRPAVPPSSRLNDQTRLSIDQIDAWLDRKPD